MKLSTWRTPIWEAAKYTEPNFFSFRKRRGSPAATLGAPAPQSSQPALSVLVGELPDATTWRASLEAEIAPRFNSGISGNGAAVQDVVGVTQPDRDFAREKGWVYDRLEEVVQGGESAYQRALRAYIKGDGGGIAGLKATVAELEKEPGNESGAYTNPCPFGPCLCCKHG